MVRCVKWIIIIFFIVSLFVSCGETVYIDKKSLSNGSVRFDFELEASDKDHRIYFNYYYKLRSAYESIDFKAKLICPDGKIYENRIRDKDKRKDSTTKIVFTGKKWRVFKIKPSVGGIYKLVINVVASNFKIEEAEVQIII